MKHRLYGLFFRLRSDGKRGRWVRAAPSIGLRKDAAVRFFQSVLLANAMGEMDPHMEYRLRPLS